MEGFRIAEFCCLYLHFFIVLFHLPMLKHCRFSSLKRPHFPAGQTSGIYSAYVSKNMTLLFRMECEIFSNWVELFVTFLSVWSIFCSLRALFLLTIFNPILTPAPLIILFFRINFLIITFERLVWQCLRNSAYYYICRKYLQYWRTTILQMCNSL